MPALVLIAIGLAAYHETFRVPELLDDRTAISHNPSIRELWPLSEPLDPPARSGTGGRPFANLTFALNYAWTATDLWSYHVVNLVIHLAAGLTLFGIVRRTLAGVRVPAFNEDALGNSETTRVALAAAALWVAHPVTTIAVTYVSQRTESLMGLLYLQTLYGFVRWVADRSKPWLIWSVAACLLGMGTKEVMVTAPVAVLLYDRGYIAGSFAAALRARWRYYTALAATWLLLALLLQMDLSQRLVGFGLGVDATRYALTESRAILLYLFKALWPANLVFDYGPAFLQAREAWPWVAALGVVCLGIGIALWRRPALGFPSGWFVLVLLPTSSVVPIAAQPVAENRVYVPLAGLTIAFAVGIYRVLGRHALVIFAVAGVALTWLSERRNHTYGSALQLWTDTIAKQPDNPRAYDNRGEALASAGIIKEAFADYERALILNPNSTQTHSLLGNAHLGSGQTGQAILHYRHAIELAPHLAPNYQNLAAALAAAGQHDAALANYQIALALDPELGLAHRNLGLLLLQLGRFVDAESQLRLAVTLDETDSRARYAWAVVLLQLGRVADGIAAAEELLRLHPEDVDARNALGVGLLRAGRIEDARRQFEHVLRTNPNHHDARANLERTLTAAQSPPRP